VVSRLNNAENLAVRYLKFNLLELINVAVIAAGNSAKSCKGPFLSKRVSELIDPAIL
jgi:hypothetical protein